MSPLGFRQKLALSQRLRVLPTGKGEDDNLAERQPGVGLTSEVSIMLQAAPVALAERTARAGIASREQYRCYSPPGRTPADPFRLRESPDGANNEGKYSPSAWSRSSPGIRSTQFMLRVGDPKVLDLHSRFRARRLRRLREGRFSPVASSP